jgi:hypothetical protein
VPLLAGRDVGEQAGRRLGRLHVLVAEALHLLGKVAVHGNPLAAAWAFALRL